MTFSTRLSAPEEQLGPNELIVGLSASNDYDLIHMNLQMPEMNGYEATKAIRPPGDGRSSTP